MKKADENVKSVTYVYISDKGEKKVDYKINVIADDGRTKTILVMFEKIPKNIVIHEKKRIRLEKVVLTTPNTLVVKYAFIS